MTKRQMDRYVVYRRVRDLARAQQGRLRGIPAAAARIEALSVAVARLEDCARQQLEAAQAHYRVRVRARRDLVQQLTLFAQTARVLERLTPNPGACETYRLFKVPRPQTDHGIGVAAALFLDKAAPLASQFADYGVTRERLRAALTAFTRAVQKGERARGRSAAAQAAIDEALKDGATAIAGLDVIVRHAWQGDAALRAAWAHTRGWQQPGVRSSDASAATSIPADTPAESATTACAGGEPLPLRATGREAFELSVRRLQAAGIPIELNTAVNTRAVDRRADAPSRYNHHRPIAPLTDLPSPGAPSCCHTSSSPMASTSSPPSASSRT